MKAAALLLILLGGCAPVEMVQTTRIDGQPCRTTKVRPDFYSAEVWTDCLDKDGRAVAVATNHTDVGLAAGLLGAVITAATIR